jgi:hypothetical protein
MRTFIIGWLVAFCVVALGAAGVGRIVASVPSPTPTPETPRRFTLTAEEADDLGQFQEADAVEVVARRVAPNATGEQTRRQIRGSATVTYHSPQHFRVCVDAACWIAHGPGRYAEPENDAARQREQAATTSQ